ncbi:MAG: hypothetical protein NUV57_06300 [archaeon]|nr:hypothetical protein [archaeon]
MSVDISKTKDKIEININREFTNEYLKYVDKAVPWVILIIAILLIEPIQKVLDPDTFNLYSLSSIALTIILIPTVILFMKRGIRKSEFKIQKNLKTGEFTLNIIQHIFFYNEKTSKKSELLEVIAKKPHLTHPKFKELYLLSLKFNDATINLFSKWSLTQIRTSPFRRIEFLEKKEVEIIAKELGVKPIFEN